MATQTYTITTSSSALANIWRKVQYGIVVAAQFGVEEWNALGKLQKYDVDWSAREITMELDVNDDINTASIPEGGKEALPSSPTTATATVTWILLNKRFTISKTAQYIQQQQGSRGQLESQLRWQGKKALQGIQRKIGDMFYGFSTGTAALISSAASAPTYTIKDMFGVTGLGSTTSNRRVADLFHSGDRVAALNPTGPALRSIQTINAVPDRSTNSITVDSSFSSGAANDLLVFANNLENTTLAGGTERSLNLVGVLDMMTSTSVHNVSSSTVPRWTPSTADSSGGRFTGIKLHALKQQATNQGGGTIDTIWWANGVERDVIAQLQAGLRFTDAFSMEMDGKPVSKGITFNTSRRVPDGYVFGWDGKNSIKKMVLLPEPGQPAFDDLYKLPDDSGLVGSIDYPCALVTVNRANMGYFSGLSQS